jgi:MYXO-CTERM domain-containing protein
MLRNGLLRVDGLYSIWKHDNIWRNAMKFILGILTVLLFTGGLAIAQTQPVSIASDDNVTKSDDREHHNFGWIGLIGLAGLAGLRRAKSEDVRRLEATGINVKSV